MGPRKPLMGKAPVCASTTEAQTWGMRKTQNKTTIGITADCVGEGLRWPSVGVSDRTVYSQAMSMSRRSSLSSSSCQAIHAKNTMAANSKNKSRSFKYEYVDEAGLVCKISNSQHNKPRSSSHNGVNITAAVVDITPSARATARAHTINRGTYRICRGKCWFEQTKAKRHPIAHTSETRKSLTESPRDSNGRMHHKPNAILSQEELGGMLPNLENW